MRNVREDSPLDIPIEVIDVALKARGPVEDREYARDPELLEKVRRGTSLLKVYESQRSREPKTVTIARRGLRKFFDLKPEYLEDEESAQQLRSEEASIRGYVLFEAKRHLHRGGRVEVVQTVKANGENAQISWHPSLALWAIASKNVCMLLPEADMEAREALQAYDKDRYRFARQIALAWLRTLRVLER